MSTTIQHLDQGRPWYRHLWPWLLMLGPFLVILAGSYTMWLAWSQQDALVVGDYYKQGKAINQDLRRDRVASSLGLNMQVRYDVASGKLQGKLLSFGQALNSPLRIHLAHATQPEKDIQIETQTNALGEFSAPIAMLEKARWQLVVESGQRDWRLNGTWHWPQQKGVELTADVTSANL